MKSGNHHGARLYGREEACARIIPEFAADGALQLKRLVTIAGGHFGPYRSMFLESSEAAVECFRLHLG
jgi:hypothetical protein